MQKRNVEKKRLFVWSKTKRAVGMLQRRAKIITIQLKMAGHQFRSCRSVKSVGGARQRLRIDLCQGLSVYGAISQNRLQCRLCLAGDGCRHGQFPRGRIRTSLRSNGLFAANNAVNKRFRDAHCARCCLEAYLAVLPDDVRALNLTAILKINRIGMEAGSWSKGQGDRKKSYLY